MKTCLRIIFLILFGFVAVFSCHSQNIRASVTEDGLISVRDDSFDLVNGKDVISLPFYFDAASPMCNMTVSTENMRKLTQKQGFTSTVIFYMADGSQLTFRNVTDSYSSFFLLDFTKCYASDFPGGYSGQVSFPKSLGFLLNKLASVNIKKIRVNQLDIPVTTPTAPTLRLIFNKGISMLGNKEMYALYGKGSSSASSSSRKSSASSASAAIDPSEFLTHPFGFIPLSVTSADYYKSKLSSAGFSYKWDTVGSAGNSLYVFNPAGYTLYGAKVTEFYAGFRKSGNINGFYLQTEYQSRSAAVSAISKIKADIQKAGYTFRAQRSSGYTSNWYRAAKGNKAVDVRLVAYNNVYTVWLEVELRAGK